MSTIGEAEEFEEGYDRLFFQAASYTAELFWRPYAEVCRLVSPLDPNKLDNANSRILEVARRALITLAAAAALVAAASSLGLFSIFPLTACFLFRSAGVALQKEGFTYIRCQGDEISLEEGEVSVMVWSLEAGRTGPSWRSRLEETTAKIKSEDPEVLILLGIEDTACVEALVAALSERYAHAFAHMGADQWGKGSQALIFSKAPVSTFHHSPFYHFGEPLHSGFDFLEIKKSPDTASACLRIAAIASQSREQETKEKREEQMEQITDALKEKKEALPTLFVGAFYLDRDDPKEGALLTKSLYHAYRDGRPTAADELAEQWGQPQEAVRGAIDYISLFKRVLPDGTTLPTKERGVHLIDCHRVEAFGAGTQKALSTRHGIFARFSFEEV